MPAFTRPDGACVVVFTPTVPLLVRAKKPPERSAGDNEVRPIAPGKRRNIADAEAEDFVSQEFDFGTQPGLQPVTTTSNQVAWGGSSALTGEIVRDQ